MLKYGAKKVPVTADGMWFAVNTRARYEEFVAKQVRGKGYDVFLPVYKAKRRWSDRTKELELPLFPGYLFCRFDPVQRLPIITIPGVIQIVGVGKTPVPVDEEEIISIQKASVTDVPREPWPFAHIGEKVRIERGPLFGIEGVLLNVKGGHRLVLSVTLLQRSVALEIDGSWVTTVPQTKSACSAPS